MQYNLNIPTYSQTRPVSHIDEHSRRNSNPDAVSMAGSLFSHLLAHLKTKDADQKSSNSAYFMTPTKAGAFTRLTPVKSNVDCTTVSSSGFQTPRIGGFLAKPRPVYLG